MKTRTILALAVVMMIILSGVALAAVPISGTPSWPVSAGGITPYIIPGRYADNSGFRDCIDVGSAFFGDEYYYAYDSGLLLRDGATYTGLPAGVTATVGNQTKLVQWSSTFGIGAVILRASNTSNVYVYEPQAMSDSGLGAPNVASPSYIRFCWNVVAEGQWCSPGYWKNHFCAWAEAGFTGDELYNDYFDPDFPDNPTLWQVVNNPQTYKGPATENVADLLSEAHPGVNYQGVRVPNSCPLGNCPWVP